MKNDYQIIETDEMITFIFEEGADVYFTADTHFGSSRHLELLRRPKGSVGAMDLSMIDNWNNQTIESSVIFHLGDFGAYDAIQVIKGRIILLRGNYDRVGVPDDFEYIVDEGKPVRVKIGDNFDVVLNHYPSKSLEGEFNLFGHIHKTQIVRENGLNVGVDCHDFKLLSVDDIKWFMDAILIHYDYEVFGGK